MDANIVLDKMLHVIQEVDVAEVNVPVGMSLCTDGTLMINCSLSSYPISAPLDLTLYSPHERQHMATLQQASDVLDDIIRDHQLPPFQ